MPLMEPGDTFTVPFEGPKPNRPVTWGELAELVEAAGSAWAVAHPFPTEISVERLARLLREKAEGRG